MNPQSPSSSSSSEAEREDDVLGVAADIQKLIASAPESIYLDLGENLEALTDEATFRDLDEVTWSEDNATSVGIKYVRADLIATPPSLPIDFKQASEQGGWLPIATAPKDGTEILAAWAERELDDEDFPSGRIVGYTRCVTRWVGGCWDEPSHLDAIGTHFDDDTAYEPDPSFWQPLPPSPHPEEGALLLGGDEGGKKGGAE